MNIEEIKDRVNKTKNAFHKLGIEGQVNINVMLNDIEFLLKEIEELKQEKEYLNCIIESDKDNYINKDKIKAKIEELEIEQESNREDLKIAIDNLIFQNIDKIGNKISINMSVRGVLQSLLDKE